MFPADACGAEVMASNGHHKGGENIVLSNANKRAETEMVLAVSVGKLLERTVGAHFLRIRPFALRPRLDQGLPDSLVLHAAVAHSSRQQL